MDFEYWEQLDRKRKAQLPTATEPSLYSPVPAQLKERRQWVMWRWEVRYDKDGNVKRTKPPYQPNGEPAKSSDPSTWNTFDVCVEAYRTQTQKFDGIGFVFAADDPYLGVDLDDCLNENGTVKEWAVPIVNELKAVCYWEVSPSGTGLKFWTRASHRNDYQNRGPVGDGKIEVYDTGRYFTVKGDKGQGHIDDGQSQVDWLCDKFLKREPKPTTRKQSPLPANSRSVDEVKRLLSNAQNAPKYERLMRGDHSEYESHSEADLALCCMITFYSQDPKVIDTIFRSSGLMRGKWDEKHYADGTTYGKMTINRAIENLTETYTPPENSRHTGKNHNRQRWGQRSWEQQRRFERRRF